VTSSFPAVGFEEAILPQNPHIKFGETAHRGYVVLELTPERAKASWHLFDDVARPVTTERVAATFVTQVGQNHLVADDEPV
jgi:alkaline phosphatase D